MMGNQYNEATIGEYENSRDEPRKVFQGMVRSDQVCVGKESSREMVDDASHADEEPPDEETPEADRTEN